MKRVRSCCSISLQARNNGCAWLMRSAGDAWRVLWLMPAALGISTLRHPCHTNCQEGQPTRFISRQSSLCMISQVKTQETWLYQY